MVDRCGGRGGEKELDDRQLQDDSELERKIQRDWDREGARQTKSGYVNAQMKEEGCLCSSAAWHSSLLLHCSCDFSLIQLASLGTAEYRQGIKATLLEEEWRTSLPIFKHWEHAALSLYRGRLQWLSPQTVVAMSPDRSVWKGDLTLTLQGTGLHQGSESHVSTTERTGERELSGGVDKNAFSASELITICK